MDEENKAVEPEGVVPESIPNVTSEESVSATNEEVGNSSVAAESNEEANNETPAIHELEEEVAEEVSQQGGEHAPADTAAVSDEVAETEEVANQEEPKPEEPQPQPEEASKNPAEPQQSATNDSMASNYRRAAWIIAIIAVAIFIGWLIFKEKTGPWDNSYDGNVNITVDPNAKDGKVNIIDEVSGDIKVGDQVVTSSQSEGYKVTAYYLNSKTDPEMKNCSEVHPLERVAEKKYDSNIINTTRSLLSSLTPEEKDKGFSSAIPDGTYLKYVKLDGQGNIEANFTGSISKAAGSCAVSAIRAQITQTLMQFSNVKMVTICIDGNCKQDAILQP